MAGKIGDKGLSKRNAPNREPGEVPGNNNFLTEGKGNQEVAVGKSKRKRVLYKPAEPQEESGVQVGNGR